LPALGAPSVGWAKAAVDEEENVLAATEATLTCCRDVEASVLRAVGLNIVARVISRVL
jgi:hypothetical protein